MLHRILEPRSRERIAYESTKQARPCGWLWRMIVVPFVLVIDWQLNGDEAEEPLLYGQVSPWEVVGACAVTFLICYVGYVATRCLIVGAV